MQKECCKVFDEYMSDIIHESQENGKTKKFLSYIKSLRTGVNILQKDGMLYCDSQDKANVLNHYFSVVFTNSNNSSDLPNMGPSPYPDITKIEIIPLQVSKTSSRS